MVCFQWQQPAYGILGWLCFAVRRVCVSLQALPWTPRGTSNGRAWTEEALRDYSLPKRYNWSEHAKVSIRKITRKCFWSYHQGQKSQVKLDLTALQFIFFVENLLFLSFFPVAAQLSRQSSNTSSDRAWAGTGQADKLWKPGVYKTLTVFPYSISGTICSLQWISKMMVMCCSSRLS